MARKKKREREVWNSLAVELTALVLVHQLRLCQFWVLWSVTSALTVYCARSSCQHTARAATEDVAKVHPGKWWKHYAACRTELLIWSLVATSFIKATIRTDTVDGEWEEGEGSEKERAARTNRRWRRERQLKSATRGEIFIKKSFAKAMRFWARQDFGTDLHPSAST